MKRIIGKEIKDFKLTAYHEEKMIEVSQEDLKGSWSVLFFYPADFTFVCPTELEDLANHHKELENLGVKVYSVSNDTHFSHYQWHKTSEKVGKVQYPMIADPKGTLSKFFGIYNKESGFADRGTFVLDPNGKVKIMEITDDGIGRNASELVRKIKAALHVEKNPGEACQANWKGDDEEALKPGLDLVGKL